MVLTDAPYFRVVLATLGKTGLAGKLTQFCSHTGGSKPGSLKIAEITSVTAPIPPKTPPTTAAAFTDDLEAPLPPPAGLTKAQWSYMHVGWLFHTGC